MVKYGNRIFLLYNLIFGKLIKRSQLEGGPPGPHAHPHERSHTYVRGKKNSRRLIRRGKSYSNCSTNHRSKSLGEWPRQ